MLHDVARLAASVEPTDLRLATRADNQAALPMVLSAGMRSRMRMAGDELIVLINVRPFSRGRGRGSSLR